MVCAPVYSEFASNAKVLPLAVDISKFEFTPFPDFNGFFKIMHAPTHRGFKGTDFIVAAIDRLKLDGYKIEFDLVEHVTHNELKDRYRQCHIFIDQIMGGWYGTASIEAMAIGRPVIVSIRKEYFDFIEYGPLLPTLHADPDNIYETLKLALDSGYDELNSLAIKSRDFVEKIHDVKVITSQLVEIYSKL